jgi:hypothetical protein
LIPHLKPVGHLYVYKTTIRSTSTYVCKEKNTTENSKYE